MKVLMIPNNYDSGHESGIRRVLEAYRKYLPQYGVEFVPSPYDSFDVLATHAGEGPIEANVAHLHGLYWTGDYLSERWQHGANRRIADTCRSSKIITVPSNWVAETFKRDMRINPVVLPHGIDYEDWRHDNEIGKYVLWNKNRDYDVCDPTPVVRLASMFVDTEFVTTFVPRGLQPSKNTRVTGVVPHDRMKKMVQRAAVYLSTTKETFGIGVLEALASGTPVLGFNHGGNRDLVQHGVTGYLAKPNDYDDLAEGLDYCIRHRKVLSENCQEAVKAWSWDKVAHDLFLIYKRSMEDEPEEVSFIIPVYNYADQLEGAVQSVLNQTVNVKEIIIVDDASTDRSGEVGKRLSEAHEKVTYIRHEENKSVAEARNTGILLSETKYVCCLDADDRVANTFVEACLPAFETKDVGVAFSKILIEKDGISETSTWPDVPDYNAQIRARARNNQRGMNQVPTCAIFKKEAWRRAGGYDPKYSPLGAGSEDAEFWTRVGSLGYRYSLATKAPLFLYSLGTGRVSGAKGKDADLVEPFWLSNKPWVFDGKHPFASIAEPVNKLSHNAYQYDSPIVSIIIPVGKKHMSIMRNAIESVVGQTERKWELILVYDNAEKEPYFMSAYPFARVIRTEEKGAGYARNEGAKIARAPFLVFLDADDELHSDFLSETLKTWRETNSIVYTDYVHKVTTESIDSFKPSEVLKYYKETNTAYIAGKSSDFDCERAQRMPDFERKDLYHWCLVTCLVPAEWHREIGGFDEEMESFEDVHYHWKMARTGKCYVRLKNRLVMYSRDTGTRRELASLYNERGLLTAQKMLQYSRDQLERTTIMPCTGCPGSRKVVETQQSVVRRTASINEISDQDVVMIKYLSGNVGNHRVVGMVSGRDYNYRKGGDVFLMLKEDVASQPHLFAPVEKNDNISGVQAPRQQVRAPIPLTSSVFHLDTLPGVTTEIANEMKANGISTPEDVIALGIEGLKEYKGIGNAKAKLILQEALNVS